MTKIRVLIADDHAILRAGLKLLIQSQPDMTVVGQAVDWLTAQEEIQRLKPEVMTVDLTMSGGVAFAQLRRLKSASPTTKLVVLTMHEDVAYFRAAIAAGVDGYVMKKSADDELMSAIRNVHAGKLHLSAELSQSSQDDSGEFPSLTETIDPECLSPREREVLQSAAYGMTNREIAERLYLSVKTIESYRSRVMVKLNLKSRADLVRYAVQHGLLATQVGSSDSTGEKKPRILSRAD